MQTTTHLIIGSGNTTTCIDKKLATDIFHFERAAYLLIIDYTSRFPVVHKLLSMTAQHVATHCKQVFSEYGWSETLISDNGPCYTAHAFTNMIQEYGVNHITSSPHYQQSNGLADNMFKLLRTCFTRQKRKERICLNA